MELEQRSHVGKDWTCAAYQPTFYFVRGRAAMESAKSVRAGRNEEMEGMDFKMSIVGPVFVHMVPLLLQHEYTDLSVLAMRLSGRYACATGKRYLSSTCPDFRWGRYYDAESEAPSPVRRDDRRFWCAWRDRVRLRDNSLVTELCTRGSWIGVGSRGESGSGWRERRQGRQADNSEFDRSFRTYHIIPSRRSSLIDVIQPFATTLKTALFARIIPRLFRTSAGSPPLDSKHIVAVATHVHAICDSTRPQISTRRCRPPPTKRAGSYRVAIRQPTACTRRWAKGLMIIDYDQDRPYSRDAWT